MRVLVTARAASEITAIGHALRQVNPRAAADLLRRIDRAIQVTIADTPAIGTLRDEVSRGLRIYVLGNYLVCYRVSGDVIRVLRVFHAKRDLTRQF